MPQVRPVRGRCISNLFIALITLFDVYRIASSRPREAAHHVVQVDVVVCLDVVVCFDLVVCIDAACVREPSPETVKAMANRNFSRTFIFFVFAFVLSTLSSAPLFAQDARPTNTDVKFHKFVPATPPENNAAAAPARQATTTDAKNSAATQQMQLLLQEKSARTPTQQKIDSNVLYTIRMMRGDQAAPGFQSLYTGVDLDDQNRIVVDIVADVTPDLLQILQSAGALVLTSYPDYRAIRAIVPPNQIEAIAASPDVSFIGRKAQAITAGFKREPQNYVLRREITAPGFELRAARVKKQIAAFLHQQSAGANSTIGVINTGQGIVMTEGDATHLAARARGVFGVNGSGLKIGVLSDSANATGAASAAQKTGDLPPFCPGPGGPCLTILQDFPDNLTTDEGAAMMEIIYDMAPGASLYFATANLGDASFASNILALQTAGCNIIVDDVFYADEPVFQDGMIAQAVNTVTAGGVLYFSSAGNEGNFDAGTAGYFEGDFNDSGSPAFPNGSKPGTLHNFHTGFPGDPITSPGEGYALQWADPFGASTNDYDLFYLNSAGILIGSSTNLQNGSQDPFEFIDPPTNANPGDQLVVFKTSSAGVRLFALKTIRGTLTIATAGETWGHSAAVAAFSVAAAPAAGAFGSGTPRGPFPEPFTVSSLLETFTSDGPRRILFNSDGSPVTPGNFSSTGGAVRNKPDITAADGVSTTFPIGSALNPFYGTSAAAPHAASIAALVMSAKPSLTPAQIRSTLTGTALDIMAPGFDRDSGNGIVMAYPALNSLGITPGANPEILSVTANENPGNGNGIIDPGEGASIAIQLKNPFGVANATGITAVLTTSTPGVTITQPAISAFPDIAFGSGIGGNSTPFTFTVASNVPCALNIQFTLTLTYAGGPTPTKALNFAVQTGVFNVMNTLGSPTPVGMPAGVTFATGLQTNRLSRNGVPTTCTSGDNFPGIIAAGQRTFDSYSFASAHTGCTPLTLTSSDGPDLFTSLYQPSFVPSSISTNYMADAGLSGSPQGLAFFAITPDAYTIVVNDSSVNGNAAGKSYVLQIPSCLLTKTANINQVPVISVHDVTVAATTIGGSANASIDNGSFDPDGDPITKTQTPPGPYPHGITNVVLTVVDSKGATAQGSANVTVADPPEPDLTVASSHFGNFVQGQTGATYSIIVTNSGAANTTGAVSVTDVLPPSMTATSISGSGWLCTLGTLSCTRSDVLAPAANYPPINLTVNVAVSAPASVINSVSVSGGAEINTANDSATDSTTITAPSNADMTITKTHVGNFVQAQNGAVYTITVSNSGTGPSAGLVTVVDALPQGMNAAIIGGTGWACSVATLICTRTDALANGSSYPPISLTVNLSFTAPASLTNIVTVAGGGEVNSTNNSASDVTTVLTPPVVSITKSHVGNFTQGQVGATYTIIVSNSGTGAATSGVVTMQEFPPPEFVPAALSGSGWNCNLNALFCNRSDSLAPGGSYPPITFMVNVVANAQALVHNIASATGGGDPNFNFSNDAANDPTTIIPVSDLTIFVEQAGASFQPGQIGAIYSITTSNLGPGVTTGTVTVADLAPAAFTPTAMSGAGWNCVLATLTCTRSDVLTPGNGYPTIILSGNVSATAGNSIIDQATISGGGETNLANDISTVTTLVTALPVVSLSDTTLTFSNQAAGTTSAAKEITVMNIGGQNLTFAGTSATLLSNTRNWAIAPGTTCASGVSLVSAGHCVINVTFSPTAAGAVGPDTLTLNDNATPSTQVITLTGTGLDFSTAGPVAPVTITAGQTANFVITLAPMTGGFPNAVTFSASGLPAASSGNFNPSSLTPGSTATSTTLSISTTARGILPPFAKRIPRTPPQPLLWILALASAFLALTLFASAKLARFRGTFASRPRFASAMLIVTLLFTASAIAGCGGGGTTNTPPPATGTPAGTSTIIVTAQSGSLVHTTTVTLTVQ
jgi:uncharacterized repeat protein (TIGR01451 family)